MISVALSSEERTNIWQEFLEQTALSLKAKSSENNIKSFQDAHSIQVLVSVKSGALWFCHFSVENKITFDFVLVAHGNTDSAIVFICLTCDIIQLN